MSFSAWAHSHARSILFLLGALAVAGAVASVSLPVALFPQVTFPRVRITLEAGDRPAEQMTVEVTTPVEEAVRAIPGVRNLRSTTSRGASEISVNFNWGEDMVSAMLQCQSQVNKILPSLPSGTSFEVERMDPTVFPVIAYSLTSDSHSLIELRDLALYTLRPALSTGSGVARNTKTNSRRREDRRLVRPERSHHRVGTQHARRNCDRHASGRFRSVDFSSRLEGHIDCNFDCSGCARCHDHSSLRPENEF